MNPIPRDKSYESTLRDGTRVLIRPVVPEDKPYFSTGFRHLSPRSRYLRFLRPVRELTGRDLKFFTEIDHVNHVAWGALARLPDGDRGIGVARYVRRPEDPQTAEGAVTIIDEYQHRGVGSRLIGALYWSALMSGITSFEGYVLAENERMKRLIRILGGELTAEGHGVMRARVSVVRDYESLPDTKVAAILKDVIRSLSEG
jgi:RimJ/RimL family protein N-acetyltransferase